MHIGGCRPSTAVTPLSTFLPDNSIFVDFVAKRVHIKCSWQSTSAAAAPPTPLPRDVRVHDSESLANPSHIGGLATATRPPAPGRARSAAPAHQHHSDAARAGIARDTARVAERSTNPTQRRHTRCRDLPAHTHSPAAFFAV
ncbi:hypothetical protein C8J57DRAFT_1470693 [Mycena rebaudengoi]|nr:hypothetical protein C8J57DRAFT_1470693 [Mycena rebaudengoi]